MQSRKDRNPVNSRSFDDAEADSLSERLAATTSTRLVRVTAGNRQIPGDRQSDGSTQAAWSRRGCDGARFEIEPQRAPGPMWLLESADRSRVRVVVASKTLRNARGLCRWKAINKVGRHVGLDFYDLLIEGDYTNYTDSLQLSTFGCCRLAAALRPPLWE